ncbi:hypothetical protein [Caudoviricetes sp.]|nr:hypothetical protein [Caudoviricetes sp.]
MPEVVSVSVISFLIVIYSHIFNGHYPSPSVRHCLFLYY